MTTFHTTALDGASVTLDLDAGHIRQLILRDGDRDLSPFHVAPWVDDPAVMQDESLPTNLRHLSGDFFCAPFSMSDVEEAPPHGWPANSPWELIKVTKTEDSTTALFRLFRRVLGATLEKRFILRREHPFLYQTHSFVGGQGAIPVANHAMAALPDGGHLAFSPKRRIETPSTPLEPDPGKGRSHLAYPSVTTDPTRVPAGNGTTVDLTRYPIAEKHEDFVMLVEAENSRLGWFATSRPTTGDAMLSLKSPLDYPVTFLWLSNGGRGYRPWNGRHTGVLGIEEGRSFSLNGHRASIAPNPFSDEGIPTALTLVPDGTVAVRNVIGAVALPGNGASITNTTDRGGSLLIDFADGTQRAVSFDSAFLAGA